jgi:hypothetical protein
MGFRTLTRWILDPWIILGAIGFGFLMLVAVLTLLNITRPAQQPSGPSTAVVTVISMPTATAVPPTATPPGPETPTPSALPLPPAGDVATGAFVQIFGTGGDGLRLRTEPGLDSEVRVLGAETEVFVVTDGPSEVDGYDWWYLESPSDRSRRGWAVANYLSVVQNP